MKSILLLILITLLTSQAAFGQELPLHGRISELNSRTRTGSIRYVEAASITAKSAKPQLSEVQGRFTLVFAGQPEGSHTALSIEKSGYEIANARELEAVVIPQLDTLRVFVADPAYLAQEQAAWLDIQTRALTREKDLLIAQLRSDSVISKQAIQELNQRYNRNFVHYSEAEEYLNQQLEEMKERLPERAAALARTNLDFASGRYQKWVASYRAGDLDAVIYGIDEEILKSEADTALEKISRLKTSALGYSILRETTTGVIDEVIASYRLKADVLELQFRYLEAAKVMDKVLKILIKKKNGIEDRDVASVLDRIANFLIDAGNYLDANSLHKKSIDIRCKENTPDSITLATAYNNISVSYLWLRDLKNAQLFQEKAISIRERLLEQTHPNLGASYNNLASICLEMNDLEKALHFQKRSISILEYNLKSDHPQIASAYNNLGTIYIGLGRYMDAKEAIQKAILLHELSGSPKTPNLASFYNSLSIAYKGEHDYDEAIKFSTISVQILTDLFDGRHPFLSHSYNSLADALIGKGELLAAKDIALKSILNFKGTLPLTHHLQAHALLKLGQIESLLGNSESEINIRFEAIKILSHDESPDCRLIAINYIRISSALEKLNRQDEAIEIIKQAIAFDEKKNIIRNEVLAVLNHNLGELYHKSALVDSGIKYESIALQILIESDTPKPEREEAVKLSLAGLHFQKAQFLMQRGAFDLALLHLDTCISHYPQKANVWITRGACYYLLGKYAEAIRSYNKAYELSPASKESYLISNAYSKWKRFKQAKESLVALEELSPKDQSVEIAWMLYYMSKGKVNSALQNLEKAIDLGFNDRQWLDNEDAFDPLRDDPRYQALLARIKPAEETD